MSDLTRYSTQMADALKFGTDYPEKLIALAVLLRWADDVRHGFDDVELGEEWIEIADVREDWIRDLIQR